MKKEVDVRSDKSLECNKTVADYFPRQLRNFIF